MGDENVAEMDVVVVSEMAGADAADSGRPLIEVIERVRLLTSVLME